jgi:hypothetical protein
MQSLFTLFFTGFLSQSITSCNARCYNLGFPNRCLVCNENRRCETNITLSSFWLGLGFRQRLMNPVSTWDPDYTSIPALSAHKPMLENRGHAHSKRSIAPREFFLPVEVYISNQAAAALRKVRSYLFCCGVPLIQRSQIA